VRDVPLAIDFVEQAAAGDQEGLWGDVVQHCLRQPDLLAQLLDYVGVCGLHPIALLAGVDPRAVVSESQHHD